MYSTYWIFWVCEWTYPTLIESRFCWLECRLSNWCYWTSWSWSWIVNESRSFETSCFLYAWLFGKYNTNDKSENWWSWEYYSPTHSTITEVKRKERKSSECCYDSWSYEDCSLYKYSWLGVSEWMSEWMNRYIKQCAESQDPSLPRMQIIGNGDVFDNDVSIENEWMKNRCIIIIYNNIS